MEPTYTNVDFIARIFEQFQVAWTTYNLTLTILLEFLKKYIPKSKC